MKIITTYHNKAAGVQGIKQGGVMYSLTVPMTADEIRGCLPVFKLRTCKEMFSPMTAQQAKQLKGYCVGWTNIK